MLLECVIPSNKKGTFIVKLAANMFIFPVFPVILLKASATDKYPDNWENLYNTNPDWKKALTAIISTILYNRSSLSFSKIERFMNKQNIISNSDILVITRDSFFATKNDNPDRNKKSKYKMVKQLLFSVGNILSESIFEFM